MTDLALLTGMYGVFAGTAHALAMVGSEGVDRQEFTPSLLVPWLSAMTAMLPGLAASADGGVEGSAADMQAVAIANIVDASSEQKVDTGLLGHLESQLREMLGARADGADLETMIGMVRW